MKNDKMNKLANGSVLCGDIETVQNDEFPIAWAAMVHSHDPACRAV